MKKLDPFDLRCAICNKKIDCGERLVQPPKKLRGGNET